MIQFHDRINSQKGFVDLHIHTNDSYGEEMDSMNLTADDLLESCYQYSVTHNNAPVTFAITDHNSIDAVKKVDLQIKSDIGKYKNIKFISGCEFTCSAGSIGTFSNNEGHIKNIVKNFHMLAYGFNPFDDNINFLCKLHSTRRNNSVYYSKVEKSGLKKVIKISAGAYVMAIKNIMKDHGYDVAIKEFKDVNLTTRDKNENTYISYLLNYIKKFKLPQEVSQDIENQLRSRNIIHLGRLDCMEIMEIVENAGGYCVLAHPYLLEVSKNLKLDSKNTKISLQNALKEKNIPFIEEESLKSLIIKYVVNKLKNECEDKYTGKKLRGIVGMEVLHSTSTYDNKALKKLINIAENNNLYMTVGGDSHGTLIKSSMLSKFLSSNKAKTNETVVIKNLFSDMILSNSLKNNTNCTKSFDEQFEIIKNENENEVAIDKAKLLKMLTKTKADEINYNIQMQQKQAEDQLAKQQRCEEKNKIYLEHLSQVREIEKIIRYTISGLNSYIGYIKGILDDNSLNESDALHKFIQLKNIRKSIRTNLKAIELNYTLVEKSNAVKYLLQVIEQFNLKNSELKTKYPSIISNDLYLTQSLKSDTDSIEETEAK